MGDTDSISFVEPLGSEAPPSICIHSNNEISMDGTNTDPTQIAMPVGDSYFKVTKTESAKWAFSLDS